MPLLKSTFAKIAIGWVFAISSGLGAFYLSKQSIEKKRYENMKSRERMRLAETGKRYGE